MRIVLCSLLVASSAVLTAQSPQGLTGTWHSSQYGFTMVLILNADGTGEFDEEPIKFRVKGTTLSVTEDGDVSNYAFALNGTSLTLSGGDLDRPMVFQRHGATGPSSPPATAGLSSARAPASATPGTKGLVGRWQGPESVVQINADNTMIIGGQTFRYSVAGSVLTLTGSDGSLPMPFELKGDTLVVAVNGQMQTLKRLGETAERSASTPGRSGASGVRPELAGKWCYFNSVSANSGGGRMTEECITLNGDGSYQYFTATSASAYAPGIYGGTASQGNDSGRWTATDTTITAQSSKGQTNTYELQKRNNKNNDPMICLDGRCYATVWQKSAVAVVRSGRSGWSGR